MIMNLSQVCRCPKSCKNAGDLSGKIWKTFLRLSMCDWATFSLAAFFFWRLLPCSMIQQPKKGDTWALRPPQCWVLDLLRSFPLMLCLTMEKKAHKTHRQKEDHIPAVGGNAVLGRGLHCQTFLPDTHTQKRLHQLGFSAQTPYRAVLCCWVPCGNHVYENSICNITSSQRC